MWQGSEVLENGFDLMVVSFPFVANVSPCMFFVVWFWVCFLNNKNKNCC